MSFLKKKSLGQHFLKNDRYASMMIDAGNVSSGDIVLEIGPGEGALTKHLLAAETHVIALEADERAIESLESIFKKEIDSGQLFLVHGDMRTFDLSSLKLEHAKYKVIANIPYYISGMLFRLFLTYEDQPNTLVFLVQKEVAERIARSEKESLLSLSVKAFGFPEYITTVSKGNFNPPPKVDSAILKIGNISRDAFVDVNEKLFFEILHTGFRSKRKKLMGNLGNTYNKNEILKIFNKLGLREDIRAEDVDIDSWLKLAKELEH